jgi:hypothetical protein
VFIYVLSIGAGSKCRSMLFGLRALGASQSRSDASCNPETAAAQRSCACAETYDTTTRRDHLMSDPKLLYELDWHKPSLAAQVMVPDCERFARDTTSIQRPDRR